MKFWDSSALVPLIANEENTEYCLGVLGDDPRVLIWCLSPIEVMGVLCRRLREGVITSEEFGNTKEQLRIVLEHAAEITAIAKVRARALRILETHPLKAADACQLAAALVGCKEEPERLAMVCLDERLKNAALKEGFIVNPGL